MGTWLSRRRSPSTTRQRDWTTSSARPSPRPEVRCACSRAPEPARRAPSPGGSRTWSAPATWPPGQVLAVTFTARAAGEMRTRLRVLGVAGVQARTFHAAALRQLRYFWPQVVGGEQWQLLEGKLRFVGQAAARARAGTDAASLRDLAGEIEWAKASLVAPGDYPAAVARLHRDTPGPAEQVAAVYAGYEELKNRAELLDFDDLLLHTAAALEENRGVAEEFRDRYRCFVVDEYQDVTAAAATRARRLARRPGRPHGGRRREPDDLHLRRGGPAAPAGLPAPVPRGRRRPPDARLPLHAAGRLRREHVDRYRAGAGRRHAAPARRAAAAGARPALPRVRRRARRSRGGRAGDPPARRRRHAGRGDRGAVPGERPVGGLRAGAHRRGRARTRCAEASGSSPGPRCAGR